MYVYIYIYISIYTHVYTYTHTKSVILKMGHPNETQDLLALFRVPVQRAALEVAIVMAPHRSVPLVRGLDLLAALGAQQIKRRPREWRDEPAAHAIAGHTRRPRTPATARCRRHPNGTRLHAAHRGRPARRRVAHCRRDARRLLRRRLLGPLGGPCHAKRHSQNGLEMAVPKRCT